MSNPRKLRYREKKLLSLYCHCEFGMTPQQFYQKWDVTHEQMAEVCDRSVSTVRGWFKHGRYYRRPTTNDLRHLGFMDCLFEYFEEIPESLLQRFCYSMD